MKKVTFLIAMLFSFLQIAVADTRIDVANFSAGSLDGWEAKSFVGQTNYSLIEEEGRTVLSAGSRGAASGIGRKITVDLTKTPYVNWSWKIVRGLPRLDETLKSGDDFAARLYLVKSGGARVWKTKVLNYVWSGNQERESVWPNAFRPKNSIMVAARGFKDSKGEWVMEKRNVREDFKKQFGKEIKTIDLVAIMTDTDNSGFSAQAAYGDIYFTAE